MSRLNDLSVTAVSRLIANLVLKDGVVYQSCMVFLLRNEHLSILFWLINIRSTYG